MNGIIWHPDPILFQLGPLAIRTYSLLMVSGILFGYFRLSKALRKEKIPDIERDRLFIRTILFLFLGARLVHCLFYDPGYYLSHPLEILLPIVIDQGGIHFSGFSGLASHGGVLGLLYAVYSGCRRLKRPMLWLLDHLAYIAPLIAALIRLGNFFNSEIIGTPTQVSWAVRFTRIDDLPRHPVQLYESLVYLLLFLTLIPLRKALSRQIGRASGVVLTTIFTARFGLEYLKAAQEEYLLSLPVSMGQLLSLPFIILGLWLWLRPDPRSKETA